MANSVAARNAAANAVAALSQYASLHTGDPGTTGANEGAGVTRALTTYPPASAGANTGSPAGVQAPAGTYTHYGMWSADSGGTFSQGGPLPSPQTFDDPTVYNVTHTCSGA